MYVPYWTYHFYNGKDTKYTYDGRIEYQTKQSAYIASERDRKRYKLGDEWKLIMVQNDHWEMVN